MNLTQLCQKRLVSLKLNNSIYQERLKKELQEIYAQNETDYFLNLMGETRENENNLLVPYLLGICPNFDITKEPKYVWGDFPDLDIDYIPPVRNYLKETYARQHFGENKVCNIATYTRFGLRSSLIDMAKVFDLDRNEILALTTKLGIKDNEGETLTWDKALELYDELRDYLEQHPEMAKAAKKIIGRIRNLSQHASGLIISNQDIADFIPLVRVTDTSQACSAWVEGLHGTDLCAVGLVKFDFLGLDTNTKIANAVRLIGKKVCALKNQPSWSDTSYLDDPKALQMANKGDLKMIFQYDGSKGIRQLAKQGGVSSFDDLTNYVSLYRPAILKVKAHETYCRRKNNQEQYEIHPVMKPILEKTHGVMLYQEQVMRILNVVGKIPLKDCEDIRKAISKKKEEKFAKYKEMFIINGQEVLSWGKEQVEILWNQIAAFSGYGFNLSHAAAYTYLTSRMLYLKAHYPLEFFTSILSYTNISGPKDYLKLKDYKHDIEKHGVKVNKPNINLSKFDCEIINNEIYYGFSRIKEIGESAHRIVKLQPYKDYKDFLYRFGTEAKVNKAIIALRLFPGDPVENYKFYLNYKSAKKTEKVNSCQLELFTYEISLPPTTNEEVDEETEKLITNSLEAEKAYYGFIWDHPLEKCKNYQHQTIEDFYMSGNSIGPIEAVIKNVQKRQGQKVSYYSIQVEDASGSISYITVWADDHERFKEELKIGNCVRLQVESSTKYKGYTLASYPRFKKPIKDFDYRVFVLE